MTVTKSGIQTQLTQDIKEAHAYKSFRAKAMIDNAQSVARRKLRDLGCDQSEIALILERAAQEGKV